MHIGLAGGGNITGTHARAARSIPGAEITAICGGNRQKVERLCAEHGGLPFTDYGLFLRHRPMELVVLGSPSGLHAAQGIAAAQHGLHVLTEKPIDVTTKRADEMIAACAKAGVKLGVIFQERAQPDTRRLHSFLAGGGIGKPILADARVKWYRPPEYYAGSRWRGTSEFDGGGALINQAIHTVDLLLWLLGDIASVQAQATTALHAIAAEDTLVAAFQFQSGALGTLVAATSVYPGYPRRIELTGAEGTVVMENDRIVRADLRTPRADFPTSPPQDAGERASTPAITDASAHRAVIEDFIRAIGEGRTPLCDGGEGRRSLAVVEAMYEVVSRNLLKSE